MQESKRWPTRQSTGCSLSDQHILSPINPKYDNWFCQIYTKCSEIQNLCFCVNLHKSDNIYKNKSLYLGLIGDKYVDLAKNNLAPFEEEMGVSRSTNKIRLQKVVKTIAKKKNQRFKMFATEIRAEIFIAFKAHTNQKNFRQGRRHR